MAQKPKVRSRKRPQRQVSGEIIHRSPAELGAHPRNSRTHTDSQVAQVAASIGRFGFNSPVLVKGDTIVAGHARVRAAVLLNLKTVPTLDVNHMSDVEVRGYIIADNKIADNAGWDDDVLAMEAFDLKESGIEPFDMGFSGDEDFFGMDGGRGGGKTDPDAVPEPPAKPKSKRGTIWLCGDHRVMCGDATEEEDVAVLVHLGKADMVFTDPPYNIDYSSRMDTQRAAPWGGMLNDDMPDEDYVEFLKEVMDWLRQYTKKGATLYVCIGWRHHAAMATTFGSRFLHKGTVVWNKGHFGLGAHYRTTYELVLFGVNGKKPTTWTAGRNESDVWGISRESDKEYAHPTQKPVELIERALINSSKKGHTVLDLFGGSGSTLIACERTGRIARIMELDPKYVDVTVRRWEDYTGKKAKRAAKVEGSKA